MHGFPPPNGAYRGPAGTGAGAAGPQPRPTPSGLPYTHLPGYTNAGEAALHQGRVGTGPNPPFQPDPYTACLVGYLSQVICDCLVDKFRNFQQHARPPSHIAPPFSAICVDRHVGTGGAATTDPPIALPLVGPGGAFTDLIDFTTPAGNNGVFKWAGLDVLPESERENIEFRIVVNDQVVPGFDAEYGGVATNPDGTWFGFPGTVADPRDVCVLTQELDVVRVQARNSFGPGPVDVAAALQGWVYPPTMQTSDGTIRGTLTDQR